jgi:hypothetical protein
MSRTFRSIALALVVTVAALAPGVSLAAAHRVSVAASHRASLGSQLVRRFFNELEHKDVAGLRKFLGPEFQIQRADSSRQTKAGYLHNLPTVLSYKLRDLRTTSQRRVIIVTYQAKAHEIINGKPYSTGYEPRLSVFVHAARGWQIVAHANFNAPS